MSDFGSITFEPTLKATPEQIYRALLDRDLVADWSESPAKFEVFPPPVGSSFLFGHPASDIEVSGTIVNLEPNHIIEEKWRLDNWPAGVYSDVKIRLSEGKGDTAVEIIATHVAKEEIERLRGYFNEYIVRSLKERYNW